MVLLPKSSDATWWNGTQGQYAPSNLDHVFASQDLTFRGLGGGASVDVIGWPREITDAAKTEWINLAL